MHSTQTGSEVIHRIDQANEALKAAVAGLSEEQLNFRPSPGAWSVAGIVEHLAIVQERVIGRIDQLLLSAPGQAPNGPPGLTDDLLVERVADRASKFTASAPVSPTGQPLPESLGRLTASRKRVVDLVASLPPDFQQRSMPHPVFGALDCHQWLVFLAGHCIRHTRQIVETKSSADFPGR